MTLPRRTDRIKFDPVRWQVERERCQITDPRPRPPFKEAEPVSDVLDGVLKKIGVSFSAIETRLQNDWINIVGADLARRTMPGKLSNGSLTVYVKGSVWLAELKRNGQAHIIQRANTVLGSETVTRIHLQAAPGGYPSARQT